MPLLDLIDETYIAAPAHRLRPLLCDEQVWARWFPDLTLVCYDDREVRGKRWTVSGALTGTAEVWLEQIAEGTIVHVYLWADALRWSRRRRRSMAARLHTRYVAPLKRRLHCVKDRIEHDRPVGEAPRSYRRAASRVEAVVSPSTTRWHVTARDEEAFDGKPNHQ